MWKPSIWISYEHPMESAGSLYIFLFFSQTLRMLRWDMVTLTQDLDMPWPASKKDWKQIGLQLQVTNHLWISTWHDVNLRDLPILAQCSQPQNWLSDENVDVPWCHDGAMMVPWWCQTQPQNFCGLRLDMTWYRYADTAGNAAAWPWATCIEGSRCWRPPGCYFWLVWLWLKISESKGIILCPSWGCNYIYIYVCINIYVYVYIYIYICMYICIYIYYEIPVYYISYYTIEYSAKL